MSKDEQFLRYLLDTVHEAWENSLITNTLRSELLTALAEIEDSL